MPFSITVPDWLERTRRPISGSTRALQQRNKETVGFGALRGEQNSFRARSDSRAENLPALAECRTNLRDGSGRPSGDACEKTSHLRAILGVEHGASDIGDPPAGLREARGLVQERRLFLYPLFERARTHAPLGVRMAAPDAGAGAGRIDEHEVDFPLEIGKNVGLPLRRPRLNIAGFRALDAIVNRREPAEVGIMGENLAVIFHCCRKRERLAARARAEIEHLLARFRAGKERRHLRALVLHLEPTFLEGGL